ncbi:hypothetical protein NFJ02_14g17810 [Pycnococcus provasolii]
MGITKLLLSLGVHKHGCDSARVVRRARRLIELGAFVIVVLDSIDTVMPAKAITIEERRIRRAEAYARATGGEDSSNKPSLADHVTDKL